MANAHQFDSDIDYLRAGMSAEALKIEAFDEGNKAAIESFSAYLEANGELMDIIHGWGLVHPRQLAEWAKAVAWEEEQLAGEDKAERLGLM